MRGGLGDRAPRGLHDTGIASGAAGEQILAGMSASSTWRSPWPLRVLWTVMPLVVGPSLADALGDRSRSVQLVGSWLAWVLWAVGLVALLVPRTLTLTVVRAVVPGAAVVSLWAASGTDATGWAAAAVGAGGAALVALAVPGLSDAFVDGSSYGAERRVALRVPFVLLLGPIPLAWAAVAAGIVTGPLLLAASRWLAGAIAVIGGVPLAALGLRQLHLLSRRWLVFVPAGVVVHDPFTLTEPVLLQRHQVTRFGPAAPGSTALDVSGGALGLVLELEVSEPISVGVRHGRDREERTGVDGLLVTPTQPDAAVEIAAGHRLAVG